MNNFVAIDFETANGRRCSACHVDPVIVRHGKHDSLDDTEAYTAIALKIL